MAARKPEFYFVSTEAKQAIAPRACYIQQTLSPIPEDQYGRGVEYLLVKIEPRLQWEIGIGTVGTIDTDELVLGQRRLSSTGLRPIYPRTDWPGWVNAGRILNEDIKRTGKVSAQDLEHILIGELWPTLEQAEKSLRMQLGRDREPWI